MRLTFLLDPTLHYTLAIMKKSLFDDDDEDYIEECSVRAAPITKQISNNYKEMWSTEREKRLDLELLVYELKSEVRSLREKLQQLQPDIILSDISAQPECGAHSTLNPQIVPTLEPVLLPSPPHKSTAPPTQAIKQSNIFDTSDSDEESPLFSASSSSTENVIKPSDATSQSSEPLTEWQKLALEEKERRKNKARQRQTQAQRTVSGGRKLSRRAVLTSTTAATTTPVSSAPLNSYTVDLHGVHLPSPTPSPATNLQAYDATFNTHSRRPNTSVSLSSSSSSASSQDDDDDWDDEADIPASAQNTTPLQSASRAGSSDSLSASSSSQHIDQDAYIEAQVILWARGRDIATLLKTVHNVYDGVLPEVDVNLAAVPAQAKEIRNAYLRIVRQCHPDKVPNAPQRTKLQAAKVFSALSDAYNSFKVQSGVE